MPSSCYKSFPHVYYLRRYWRTAGGAHAIQFDAQHGTENHYAVIIISPLPRNREHQLCCHYYIILDWTLVIGLRRHREQRSCLCWCRRPLHYMNRVTEVKYGPEDVAILHYPMNPAVRQVSSTWFGVQAPTCFERRVQTIITHALLNEVFSQTACAPVQLFLCVASCSKHAYILPKPLYGHYYYSWRCSVRGCDGPGVQRNALLTIHMGHNAHRRAASWVWLESLPVSRQCHVGGAESHSKSLCGHILLCTKKSLWARFGVI